MVPYHVHISKGVSKLGANIPSVSLPPAATCRADAPCKAKCYAQKGRFRFPKTKSNLDMNLQIWNNDPLQFERDIIIAAFANRYFRWHVAGDIPDPGYFEMMVRVAVELPDTNFLAFTKQFEIVNSYLSKNDGLLPKNLKIVFSDWGDFHPENPYHLPRAFVRLKKSENSIPAYARPCSKFCGECVMSGKNCWNLNCGEAVVFDEH